MVYNFGIAVSLILELEDGYVFDTDDPGGETKYGISKKAYPEIDIKNLKKADAIKIYHKDYWLKANCEELPGDLGLCFFDSCVNHGIFTSKKLLQSAVGVKIDGVFGVKTISAIKRFYELPGNYLVESFLVKRLLRYASLTNFKKYGGGWSRRILKVLQVARGVKELDFLIYE